MKLCRIVHETLNYHVKWNLWPENKNTVLSRFSAQALILLEARLPQAPI